jgi:hypothetical protein
VNGYDGLRLVLALGIVAFHSVTITTGSVLTLVALPALISRRTMRYRGL